MAKTKISEYSATANSNTDVASINIDEGCAPSGINNAIRAVMGHLKDFQQGTNGDPFNGPVNGTLGATTASTANVTTLTTSSTVTHNGGTANGVAYLNGSKVLTTGSGLVFDSSGNLGLGVTPSGWSSAFKATQIGNYGAFIAGQTNQSQVFIGANAYTDGTWKYINTSQATRYYQNAGTHVWDTAGAGTAGNAITFTQAMTLDASGNLLVGSTTQNGRLTVKNPSVSGNQVIYAIQAGTSTSQLASWDLNQTTDVSTFGTDYGAPLAFKTNATERARITSSGNLLVGTTTDVSTIRMQVWSSSSDNTAYFRNSNATPYGPSIKYTAATPNGTGSEFLYCEDSTALRVSLRSNGGIANYSANNVNLSDERTKTDIQDAGGYLAKICAIPVRTFKYKDQTDDLLNLGVIAQEVEAVAPELVDVSGFGETPEDGVPLKAIYQTDLQYALMKCIQEQNQLIQQLTDRITILEGK